MRFFRRRKSGASVFDREVLAAGVYDSICKLKSQRARLLDFSESTPEPIVEEKRKGADAIAVRISELERCRYCLSIVLAPRDRRVGAELQTAITETNCVIASLAARLDVNPLLAEATLKAEIDKLSALIDMCINT